MKIQSLYAVSRARYTRSLQEAKKDIVEKKEEIAKLEEFGAPIL